MDSVPDELAASCLKKFYFQSLGADDLKELPKMFAEWGSLAEACPVRTDAKISVNHLSAFVEGLPDSVKSLKLEVYGPCPQGALQDLSSLTRLRKLSVDFVNAVGSLEGLPDVPLMEIRVRQNGMTQLHGLEHLTRLTELELDVFGAVSDDFVRLPSSLERLCLDVYGPSPAALAPLNRLKALVLPRSKDFSSLEGLPPSLEFLNLKASSLEDLSGLERLPHLRDLILTNIVHSSALEALTALNLRSLAVSSDLSLREAPVDLTFLADCEGLEFFTAHGEHGDFQDFSFPEALPISLRGLDVGQRFWKQAPLRAAQAQGCELKYGGVSKFLWSLKKPPVFVVGSSS